MERSNGRLEQAAKMWGKSLFSSYQTFSAAKLPKWYGERPGKKGKDPETPEEEEEAVEQDEDLLENLDKEELQAEEEGEEEGDEEYEEDEEEGEEEEE